MSDPSDDAPDLLSQATAAQPMTHAPRSSRHRRRRRRRGPSTALIVGVVIVVVVIAAAAVIIFTHSDTTSTATKQSDLVDTTWTYHDLNGHGVTVQPTSAIKFVSVQDGEPVPATVNAVDLAVARHDCQAIGYVYATSVTYDRSNTVLAGLSKTDASAFAAYAHDQARLLHCSWVKK